MSTILEALRRAQADRELEREREARARAAPGLFDATAVDALPPAAERSGPRWLHRLLTLLALAALLAAAWWLGRSTPTPPPPAAAGAAAATAAPSPVPAPLVAPPAAPDPPRAEAPPSPVATAPAHRTPEPSTAPAAQRPALRERKPLLAAAATRPLPPGAASQALPSVFDLPPAQRPPPLQVGGSMHSPDPLLRSLILNGQLYREGDEVAPGWVLERIETRRAVLRQGERRVALPLSP